MLTSRGDSASPNSTRSHWLVWPLNNSGIGFIGFKILANQPGSTSTKIALYDDEQPTLALTLRHSAEDRTFPAHHRPARLAQGRWYSKHSQGTTST